MRAAGFDLRPLLAKGGNAAIAAALAFVVSPLGIRLLTRREDLTFRVMLISVCLCAFLSLVAAAAVATGRARRFMFHLIALTLPLPILAGFEATAIATNLADRIAPIEDGSVYAARNSWPAHFKSEARTYTAGGLRLYRPWQGDGIFINALGLRTGSPQPKRPGEWRIAATGGSTVWGAFIRDADTIPVQLARALHERGYGNVTVYNFGIEGAELDGELALLKRFREPYALDQVLFYTGGNDAIFTYYGREPSRSMASGFASLELVKAWSRVAARQRPGGPALDPATRARLRTSNNLSGLMTAAAGYCAAQQLICDFALQPGLLTRADPVGAEAALKQGVEQTFPGLAEVWDDLYAGALRVGPAGHVYDLRGALDDVGSPVFGDMIHVNEIGNRAIAQRLLPIVLRALPQR